MATISEKLRFRAKVRGESDLRSGRKRPEYGPEAELEWKAADVIDALEKVAAIFLGEDERFQIAIGGNPHAIDKMLAESRAALSLARGDS